MTNIAVNLLNHQELSATELDLVVGGIDWGVVGASALAGGLGAARYGAASGNPWVTGGAAVVGAIGSGLIAAGATWDD